MSKVGEQIASALARVGSLDHQSLLILRDNALPYGDAAAELILAIEVRLAEFNVGGGMARHRLDFARAMLGKLDREPALRWVAARDLFNRARCENADSPFAAWMEGNSARQIPLTKALEDVLAEFPEVERRKDGVGQGDRVYFRRLR